MYIARVCERLPRSQIQFRISRYIHREIRQISDQKSVLDSPKGTQSTHLK